VKGQKVRLFALIFPEKEGRLIEKLGRWSQTLSHIALNALEGKTGDGVRLIGVNLSHKPILAIG